MGRVKDNKIISLGPDHKILIDGPAIQDNDVFGWKDMTANMSSGRGTGASAPSWAAFRGNIEALEFSAGTMNEVFITFHPNHDIIEGENFYPHIHWSPNGTGTGTVRWGIEYSIAKGFDQEAFPEPTTIYVEHEITTNSQYRHLISEVTDAQAIPMPEVDSLVLLRIFRDAAHANDDFASTVFGLTADLHYRSGKFNTVGKRPDFNVPD